MQSKLIYNFKNIPNFKINLSVEKQNYKYFLIKKFY